MMKIQDVETTAQWCAEQAYDLSLLEKMPWPAGQEILKQWFARAIEHGVYVYSQTMTRAEVEAFARVSSPRGYVPVYVLAVGVCCPEGLPAFAIKGFLADREPTPEEIKAAGKAALDAFGYPADAPRHEIRQGTRTRH